MEIKGRDIALKLYEGLKRRVGELQRKGVTPQLAVILIGNNPSSESYVAQKKKWADYIGAKVTLYRYAEDVAYEQVKKKLEELNVDTAVHAILIQRPTPKQIHLSELELVTDPQKDIDGFHPDSPYILPLPLAVEEILKFCFYTLKQNQDNNARNDFLDWLKSKNIVILGKGETAGKPIIDYFNALQIPFTLIDSKTSQPKELTQRADIAISAVGRKNVISTDAIKKGVILIGVGLFKGEDGRLHGDYEEEAVKDVAAYYTPTPGGVGPVNVAMLLENLVTAAERQAKI